jgi:hypothetical protein
LTQRGKCKQMVAGHSAQVASAWARNENQNKFHVQPCRFHCFLKILIGKCWW